jgi:hypothetical protein
MITANEVESLNLPIQANDVENCLLIENALNWIKDNTTISINMNDLTSIQANVRLFIIKYIDIMKLPIGVTSESATGLSQSFDTTDKSELILSLARSIFSDDVVTAGKVKFIAANDRWE